MIACEALSAPLPLSCVRKRDMHMNTGDDEAELLCSTNEVDRCILFSQTPPAGRSPFGRADILAPYIVCICVVCSTPLEKLKSPFL